jgi:2-hydroxychromene-2-carboxylate isomerase
MRVDWWFDYISPFAYLAFEQLERLPPEVEVSFRPTLFAGLLKAWDHKGPAEIEPKRIFTYQHSQWLANKLGVPLVYPRAHPFNPLPYLRLSLALDCERSVIARIFRSIWSTGAEIGSEAHIAQLQADLGIAAIGPLVDDPSVKARLRENVEEAVSRGVFGVPTITSAEHLFWGLDAIDFFLDYVRDPSLMTEGSIGRAGRTRVGQHRNG